MQYPFKYPEIYAELARQGKRKKELADALGITLAGLRYKQSNEKGSKLSAQACGSVIWIVRQNRVKESRPEGRRKGRKFTMKIIIKGDPKEIAGLVLELQSRPQSINVHGVLNQGEIQGDTNSFFDGDKLKKAQI